MITKQQALDAADGPFKKSVTKLEGVVDAALKAYNGKQIRVNVHDYDDKVVDHILNLYAAQGWTVKKGSISQGDQREQWYESTLDFS